LCAANILARAGHKVLVLEAHPTRVGGAASSDAFTLPGFTHDAGAAFFPFGRLSPAWKDLGLTEHGLVWKEMPVESCHPAPDGSVAAICRTPERQAQMFGSPRDADAWRRLVAWHASVEEHILGALLGPIPAVEPALAMLPFNLPRLAWLLMHSGRGLSERLFTSDAARRVLPSLALHVDVGPDDMFGAGLGYMLGLTATTGGYVVPEGGAQAITNTLLKLLRANGGDVMLGARVDRIVVRDERAVAVRLQDGSELEASRAILANTSAPSLFTQLVEEHHLPGVLVKFMRRFPQGWGTFKMDWALSGPVPWAEPLARESAVVHAGDSLADLASFTQQVRAGQLPSHPYLVVGQQSLADPTRAPAGQQTLWCYSRVPPQVEGGWGAQREAFADRIEARIEELAPGFRSTILARHVVSPDRLEAMDANLIGGDLGGGSNAWHRQLIFRPMFPYYQYRTPVRGLYLCSSYAHPGAGVHGMCGYNAAQMVLRDV